MNDNFRTNLQAAYGWIRRTRCPRTGGSRGFYALIGGWAPAFPHATGSIIPTILQSGDVLHEADDPADYASSLGTFLLEDQDSSGAWSGDGSLSVLQTAHALKGLCALYERTGNAVWLQAASRAAHWLAKSLDGNFLFTYGCRIEERDAAYHTQIAAAMLEVWSATGETDLRRAAVGILQALLKRRTVLGAFRGWGFSGSDNAFTHTIGYTIRGFLDSARLLQSWDAYGKPVMLAVRRFADHAIASRGSLAGAYDSDWRADNRYTCASGNAQVALALCSAYHVVRDDRFVEAARALISRICKVQATEHPIGALRGAITGSSPIWGRYMPGCFPAWSAKYLCDAIIALQGCSAAKLDFCDTAPLASKSDCQTLTPCDISSDRSQVFTAERTIA